MVDSLKIGLALAFIIGPTMTALADGDHGGTKHRHRHVHVPIYPEAPPPPAYAGGRLVYHPAFNIACQTRDRAIRALPCDQPVWVYGSPCEIDLGLGRWRNCDDPPGVV